MTRPSTTAAGAAAAALLPAVAVVVSEAHFTPNYGEKNSTKNSSDSGWKNVENPRLLNCRLHDWSKNQILSDFRISHVFTGFLQISDKMFTPIKALKNENNLSIVTLFPSPLHIWSSIWARCHLLNSLIHKRFHYIKSWLNPKLLIQAREMVLALIEKPQYTLNQVHSTKEWLHYCMK